MSMTKMTAKWCKTASYSDLQIRRAGLLDCIDRERNPIARSSLRQRLEIVESAIKRHPHYNPVGLAL